MLARDIKPFVDFISHCLITLLYLIQGSKTPVGQVHVQASGPPRSPSPGSEPSYAKPHKSRNLSQSSSANSSLQVKNTYFLDGPSHSSNIFSETDC